MCPFVEKKKKKRKEKKALCLVQQVPRNRLHHFFNLVQPPRLLFQPPTPLINNYYNVQPSYYSVLESKSWRRGKAPPTISYQAHTQDPNLRVV